MSTKRKTPKRNGTEENQTIKPVARAKRRTFAITQRGVKTSHDLSNFHAAALADIDSGAADLREMARMTAITGQMIAHENLKLRAGIRRGFLSLGK
ncbi:MAG TPA: hypothetical protein VGQ12_07410 [Candidatus Angelobacter sp.]|jgi:hypothetical protein|nr:hypothetical protein [Candidatus Angelobacter sp.]